MGRGWATEGCSRALREDALGGQDNLTSLGGTGTLWRQCSGEPVTDPDVSSMPQEC